MWSPDHYKWTIFCNTKILNVLELANYLLGQNMSCVHRSLDFASKSIEYASFEFLYDSQFEVLEKRRRRWGKNESSNIYQDTIFFDIITFTA